MNMQSLMAQAQKMQRDINKKKDAIDAMEFEGKSELVNVVVNGKKDILSVKIVNTNSLDQDDIEALEDMVKIAINDAFKKVDAKIEQDLGTYSSQLGGLF